MFRNSPEEQRNIEKSIKFLVANFEKSGNNPKPVILHSIKVGMKLLEYEYDQDIIIAGMLHDIIEDTDIEYNNILNFFNKEIADIVQANTFNNSIQDRFKKGKELIDRCISYGKNAVIVKTADKLDTIEFQKNLYKENKDDEFLNSLIDEHLYFLQLTESIMGNEKIWNEFKEKLNKYLGKSYEST